MARLWNVDLQEAGLLQRSHLWWRAVALLTGEHIARPVSQISTQISFPECLGSSPPLSLLCCGAWRLTALR